MEQKLNITCKEEDFSINSASFSKPSNEVTIDFAIGDNKLSLTLDAYQAARIMLTLEDIGVRKIHAFSGVSVNKDADEKPNNEIVITKFESGDKVVLINVEPEYEFLEDEEGTIIRYDENKSMYAVYFNVEDKSRNLLHDCDGILNSKQGIWVYEEEMEFKM